MLRKTAATKNEQGEDYLNFLKYKGDFEVCDITVGLRLLFKRQQQEKKLEKLEKFKIESYADCLE